MERSKILSTVVESGDANENDYCPLPSTKTAPLLAKLALNESRLN